MDKVQSLGRAGARDLCIMPSRPETGSWVLITLTYKINTLQRKFTCCQISCQGLDAHSSFKSPVCFHFFIFFLFLFFSSLPEFSDPLGMNTKGLAICLLDELFNQKAVMKRDFKHFGLKQISPGYGFP